VAAGGGIISIGSAVLPAPTDYSVEEESIGRFERNAAGNLVGDLVAVKKRINCGWKMLEDSCFREILKAARGHFASVEFYDPATGESVISEMAVNARSGRLAAAGAEKWWADVSVSFNEI
jgi:hypothetical protein